MRYDPELYQLMIVGRVMTSEGESMTIDELFALRKQMQEVLTVKLLAKKGDA